MIIVGKQQMEALDIQAERRFVDRLVAEVREHHGDVFGRLPDDAIRDLVDSGLERARAFGFSWQSSLASFVHLMFAVAPSFYRHPAVRAVLTDARIPLEDRVARLPAVVPARVWAEIRDRYDVTAW